MLKRSLIIFFYVEIIKMMVTCTCVLPEFEGCTADTIMVVAVGCPATKDCVEAVGTSVPCGVVITNPAKRKRKTVIWPSRSHSVRLLF